MYNKPIATTNSKQKATKMTTQAYTLMTQEHAQSAQEFRTIESLSFAEKMGVQGGFYKVQLIDEMGVILTEWKA